MSIQLPILALLFACTIYFPTAGLAQVVEVEPIGLSIIVINPGSGRALDSDSTPYSVGGKLGDGVPDKLKYVVAVDMVRPLDGVQNSSDLAAFVDNLSLVVAIVPNPEPESDSFPDWNFIVDTRQDDLAVTRITPTNFPRTGTLLGLKTGDIDLSFDAVQGMVLGYRAMLLWDGLRADSFYTEITVGNPELTIRSTIISDNLIAGARGIKATSTVEGRMNLEFSSDYQTLSGIGPLNYELFEIEENDPSCTVVTTGKIDGSWRASEIVFADGFLRLDAAPDSVAGLSPPAEVVIGIAPGIRESANVVCSAGGIPLPMLMHFFSGFASIHGGAFGHTNELVRDREGYVITDWEAGTGNVIGRKIYDRQGTVEVEGRNATLIERTEIVLQWPERE